MRANLRVNRASAVMFFCALVCLSIVTGASAAPDTLHGDIKVHDPSLIKQGDTYYLFSTGDSRGLINQGNIQIRKSTDLINWQFTGTVFLTTPQWITTALGFRP